MHNSRDYRTLRYDRVDIPDDVARGVTGLMTEFRLAFAAIDFVVRPDGEWVFDPGGQFGWLEAETGAPRTDALAHGEPTT